MDVDNLAFRVVAYMDQRRAYRQEGTGKIENYVTAFEIAEALDFPVKHWTQIKEVILSKGYTLAFVPGRGHYLGFPGEEIKNVIFTARMANGWHNRALRYIQSLPPEKGEDRLRYLHQKGLTWKSITDWMNDHE